ncbi:MAG TPA: FG-GAP-like repeat-containing protein, partial [Tepidisphaeraceae bacterium]|nr:FG-GAP-like repeat-containing protein [Tepidisphaeraceae bacterium]
AVNGVATFNDLSIDQAGSYTLEASDGTLADGVSNSFTINPASATKLGYIQQPTGTIAGGVISPAVAVAVEDKFGNVETSDGTAITIALASGSGTLSGTLMRNASSGVVSFNDLSIQPDGTYTLIATDGALASATSVSFTITPAPPKLLAINRLVPVGPLTSDSSVEFQVIFSEPVTGVSASAFTLVVSGVTTTTPVVVGGSGSTYTVTVNGISSGSGSLGLKLVDNGSIKNGSGQTLQGSTVSFQPQRAFDTGAEPASVAVADLNGDGKADMVVANYGTFYSYGQTVSVLLGNGDGTFQAQQVLGVGSGPDAVAIADVNGDGIPDLIVANSRSNDVSVLLGNGNGTFKPQVTYATGAGPSSIAVANLNGDGYPDLVVTNSGGHGYYSTPGDTVSVLLNNGDGTFKPQQELTTGYGPSSVAIADLNGDGHPDLVVTNFGGGGYLSYPGDSVSVLLGNGDGTFKTQQTFDTGKYGPDSVAIADLNGDGNPDLVVADFGIPYFTRGNTVSVLLGKGDGTFQSPQFVNVGTYPESVAISDLNGDGKPDIIVANAGSDNVSVLVGNGNGSFQAQQTFAAGTGPAFVAVSDLNGDGKPDLVVANAGSYYYPGHSVSVLLGNSTANVTGQTYTIVPILDTITGTTGIDPITLIQDPDRAHIDWTLGATTDQMSINDLAGLTINGNGGNDTITLDYTNGNPLPNTLHLNGTFTIKGLQGTNPLAGASLDIGRSTVFISYSTSDPIAAIQNYLHNGYNAGAWNGTPTATTGVITSAAAAANPNHNTAIGYADSADGQGVNTMPNTIELTYTLYGDANLDHQVNSADLQILLAFLNRPGSWDQGDFNYDGQVNSADLQALLFTLNTSLGSQATPMVVAATQGVTTPPTTGGSARSKPSPHLVPAIHATGTTGPVVHQSHSAKVSARKRR